MLYSIVLLFDIRMRLVGLNKTIPTFMPHLGAKANHFLSQEVGV